MPRVGAHAVRDRGDAARPGRLLVGDRVHEQVAGEADVEPGERLGGQHHRRDAALHVAGAAAVELAVAHDRRVRVVRPALLGLAGDDVDVAVEQEAAPAARPGEARQQLRPAVEVEVERHLRARARPRAAAPRRRPTPRRPRGARRAGPAARPRRAPDRRDRARSCRSGSVRRQARRARHGARRSRRSTRCSRSFIDCIQAQAVLAAASVALLHQHAEGRAAALRIATAPRATAARRRGAAAARSRPRAPCASSHSGCGTSSVVRSPSSSPAARSAPKSTSTVMSCVPGRGERIAPGHAAEVRAQPRQRPLVARGARLAVVEDDQRPALERSRERALQLAPGRATRRTRRPRRGMTPAARRGSPSAPAGGPGTKREAAVGADVDEQLARPAQAMGRAGVVHLVGDDRPADAGELRELDAAGARHARPRLGEHARRALAEHELERQVGQLGGEPRGQRAVPGPTSTSVNGRGRPRRSQTARRSAPSARARNGAAIGRGRERAAGSEPGAAGVEAVLRRRRARSP